MSKIYLGLGQVKECEYVSREFHIRSLSEIKMLNLPNQAIEDANELFTQARYKRLYKGVNMEHTIAACVYISSRQHQQPNTLREICAGFNIDETPTFTKYKLLLSEFNIQLPVLQPEPFLYKYTSHFRYEPWNVTAAETILALIKSEPSITKTIQDPSLLAIMAVYLATYKKSMNIWQEDMAKVAMTTSVTIRKHKHLIINNPKINLILLSINPKCK